MKITPIFSSWKLINWLYFQKQFANKCNHYQSTNGILNRSWENPKIQMGEKKIPNNQSNMNRKSKNRSITIPGFKLHFITKVGRTKWYWHRHTDQWTRMKTQK